VRQVAENTTNKQRMDEFSMVYYNNLLSVPCIMVLMFLFGKHGRCAACLSPFWPESVGAVTPLCDSL